MKARGQRETLYVSRPCHSKTTVCLCMSVCLSSPLSYPPLPWTRNKERRGAQPSLVPRPPDTYTQTEDDKDRLTIPRTGDFWCWCAETDEVSGCVERPRSGDPSRSWRVQTEILDSRMAAAIVRNDGCRTLSSHGPPSRRGRRCMEMMGGSRTRGSWCGRSNGGGHMRSCCCRCGGVSGSGGLGTVVSRRAGRPTGHG